MCKKHEDIQEYVENNILPQYKQFDKAHQESHVRRVIDRSIILALEHGADVGMVYTIAAYHDLGLLYDRKNHEHNSGIILQNDTNLRNWFSAEQITIMKEAVEDHRASNGTSPRSLYGKIVAEADRDISLHVIITRTWQYSLEHFPDYNLNEHIERIIDHIESKYGEKGYINLWLHSKENEKGLADIRKALMDKDAFRQIILSVVNGVDCNE